MIIVGMAGGLITSIILENVEDSRKYIDKFIKYLMGISMLSLVILFFIFAYKKKI